MTDRKGASAPGFLRDYNDASSVTHEEWLWLAEWLDAAAKRTIAWRRDDHRFAKFSMAAAACRVMHEQTRESGDG